MKIDIQPAGRKTFRLYFPTRLILNPLTAFFLAHRINRKVRKKIFTAKQFRRIFHAICKERKRLGSNWELVQVHVSGKVQIRIFP